MFENEVSLDQCTVDTDPNNRELVNEAKHLQIYRCRMSGKICKAKTKTSKLN